MEAKPLTEVVRAGRAVLAAVKTHMRVGEALIEVPFPHVHVPASTLARLLDVAEAAKKYVDARWGAEPCTDDRFFAVENDLLYTVRVGRDRGMLGQDDGDGHCQRCGLALVDGGGCQVALFVGAAREGRPSCSTSHQQDVAPRSVIRRSGCQAAEVQLVGVDCVLSYALWCQPVDTPPSQVTGSLV